MQQTEFIKSVRHVIKLPDGIYVSGTVQGYPVIFTADTGASKTVLSKRVYESMRPDERPPLSKACKLIGADGTNINDLGNGEFTIQLGTLSMQVDAVVAEIDDDALLGIDVLHNSSYGPVDFIMSKGVLVIAEQGIPIIQICHNTPVRSVNAADDSEIPEEGEDVTYVFKERQEGEEDEEEGSYGRIRRLTRVFKEASPDGQHRRSEMKNTKKTKRTVMSGHFCQLSQRVTSWLNSKRVGGDYVSPWWIHTPLMSEHECVRVESGMDRRKIGQLMEQEPQHRKVALKARGQLWKRF